MCIIETTQDVTCFVIYDVGDGFVPPEAEFEHFAAGTKLDVDIYDTDGDRVCIQFPLGEIVAGIPVDWFRFVSRCPTCEDPFDPDPDRSGPLGCVPRARAFSRVRQRLVESFFLRFPGAGTFGPL